MKSNYQVNVYKNSSVKEKNIYQYQSIIVQNNINQYFFLTMFFKEKKRGKSYICDALK